MADSESFPPFTEEELQTLEHLKLHNRRGLFLMGCVSERIAGELKPVIVGGFAVEFYSAGGYSTSDIDLAYIKPERIGKILESIGFKKVNRHWVSERFNLQVEVPSHAVDRTVLEHAITVEVDGRHAVMIGIEDLIIDRLCSSTYAQSTGDLHWATSLYATFDKRLDHPYLEQRARAEKVEDALQRAKAQAESSGHDPADRELR